MCGIVGVLSFTNSAFRVSEPYLTRMRDVMSHRGPDGAEIFVSGDRRLGLGFRRLAIIDLSEKAAQPMTNEDFTPAVEADGIGVGIRESIFKHLSSKGAMRVCGGISRRVGAIIALLVCVFPGSGSAGQISSAAPCAASDSGSQVATPTSSTFTRRDSPTFFPFMPSRYEQTWEAIRGYQRSGVPLIALHGQEWRPAAKTDDLSFAYFIPQIVRFTHADLDRAIDTFLVLLLAICFASGTAGIFFWLQNTLSRIAAIIGFTGIAAVSSLVGDIYMAQSAIVVAVVPWALYFWRQQKIGAGALVFAFFVGFGSALSNLTRFHTGTPVVLFLAVLLFAIRAPVSKRALVAVLVIAGFIVPVAYFQMLVSRRDAVLEKVDPSYKPIVPHHPFWHSVYVGLGFLNNDYGLKMLDEIADSKARSIKPGVEYQSPEYERILRSEVFRIAKSHPRFIFETFAAKSGLLFIILLVCANLGLPSALLYRKPWAVEAAFWSAFAFTATQGLLVSPNPDYLLGYMAFAVLYGVLGIDFALAHGARNAWPLSQKTAEGPGKAAENPLQLSCGTGQL